MEDLEQAQENDEYVKSLDTKGRRGSLTLPKPPSSFKGKSYASDSGVSFRTIIVDPIGLQLMGYFMDSKDRDKRWICEFLDFVPDYHASPGLFVLKHTLERYPGLKIFNGSHYQALETRLQDMSHAAEGNRDELAALLDPFRTSLTDYLEKEHEQNFLKSDYYQKYLNTHWAATRPIDKYSFTILRPLGKGAFGIVSGAQLKSTGKVFALKAMNKMVIKGKKAIKFIKAEKDVLKDLGERPSPFVLSLKYSFDDENNFYLVLPLLVGGDLDFHLREFGAFNSERCKVYTIEIALGLQHLHDMGYLYRDLKPENILLSADGRCAISDLGLAVKLLEKHKNGKVKGRAGTPGYWPPQMPKKESYGKEADWWSLGVCLFEFYSRICPFDPPWTGLKNRDEGTLGVEQLDADNLSLGGNVAFEPQGEGKGRVPKGEPFTEEAKSIIRKFLNPDPDTRMCSKDGITELVADPYFKGLDFGSIKAQHNKPPFKPDKNSVNAMSQEDIAAKGNERKSFMSLKLLPEDQITDIKWVNKVSHHRDVAEVSLLAGAHAFLLEVVASVCIAAAVVVHATSDDCL